MSSNNFPNNQGWSTSRGSTSNGSNSRGSNSRGSNNQSSRQVGTQMIIHPHNAILVNMRGTIFLVTLDDALKIGAIREIIKGTKEVNFLK